MYIAVLDNYCYSLPFLLYTSMYIYIYNYIYILLLYCIILHIHIIYPFTYTYISKEVLAAPVTITILLQNRQDIFQDLFVDLLDNRDLGVSLLISSPIWESNGNMDGIHSSPPQKNRKVKSYKKVIYLLFSILSGDAKIGKLPVFQRPHGHSGGNMIWVTP